MRYRIKIGMNEYISKTSNVRRLFRDTVNDYLEVWNYSNTRCIKKAWRYADNTIAISVE